MGKTRAEIQRNYRARKREKEGYSYIQQERDRVKKYYTPIAERSNADAKERRRKVRGWVERFRSKEKSSKEELPSQESVVDEDSIESRSTDDNLQDSTRDLIVKLPFCSPQAARKSRRRVSRATSRQRREITQLQEENRKLTRQYKTVSRRYQRVSHRLTAVRSKQRDEREPIDETQSSITPRKRSKLDLRSSGISPSKIPRRIRNKLVLANVINDEIQTARKATGKRGKAIINRIISGGIVKKYRMKSALGKTVGLNRHSLHSISKKSDAPRQRRLYRLHLETKQKVEYFLNRDDNSRQMPGKADYKTVDGQQKQKRVLSDSLSNLCLKFTTENPYVRMSFATFCRLRPAHLCLTKYISRNRCPCQKHQNFALLLKAARCGGSNVPLSPEQYIKDLTNANANELMSQINKDNITYEQWKSVNCDDGKKRMKVVPSTCSKEEFTELFIKRTCEFQEHSYKIKSQYKAMSDLKKQLPGNHIIIQMDFAENFSCVSANEIQSAYWNQSSITHHPVVVYYSADGLLCHKSFVFVTDDPGHNAGAVFAFLHKLILQIQADIGPIQHVHYWTDSPSSQYRNKTIFHIVSDHVSLFGVTATWNYFESGHGKGPYRAMGSVERLKEWQIFL